MSDKQFRKRNAILTCLRHSHAHPSAEWIYTQLKPQYPGLSLATVYRNLSLFKQQGIIASLGSVGGVERFDGDTAPHVHFVCETCGRILDLPGVLPPEALQAEAESQSGCRITGCSLTFSGRCQACRDLHVGGESE